MTYKLTPNLKTLRLVTRKSALALWQAHYVKHLLEALHADVVVNIIGVSTAGDKNLEVSLSKIGGKGLFVKELEEQLLMNQADIAVHSMKDVPALIPKDLCIEAILERADPRDVLVSSVGNIVKGFTTIQTLPMGAVVGSSSLRRQSQLYALRPDLKVKAVRGNVDTRIQKLDSGTFDAILLAASGLQRLGLDERISDIIAVEHMLPAVGQGALGIECRLNDEITRALIAPLHHTETGWCVGAERKMNALLEGGCQLPVAGFAFVGEDGLLTLKGFVGTADGRTLLYNETKGPAHTAEYLGEQVAMALLTQGAQDIIDGCYS